MSDLPEPLTQADCNLQDFAFMPLDVARLRDSDLAANESPEACWAAVQLWAASWHQVPAASIPDDDKWLAQKTGYGRIIKEWLKVRAGALRGFVKCSDGRLYHPVVAEKAREAWQAKLEQRYRTECARIKKHNDRHGTKIDKPEFSEWLSLGCPQGQPLFVPRDKNDCPETVPSETPSKGQGEGQGQGQGDSYLVPSGTLSPDKLPPCPHDQLIDLFGHHLPTLPQPKKELWEGKNADAMRSRWKWVLTAKKKNGNRYATTKDEAIEWFVKYFSHVEKSDFLTGRNGKFSACDLGWLVKADNFAKVLQGNYDNKAAT